MSSKVLAPVLVVSRQSSPSLSLAVVIAVLARRPRATAPVAGQDGGSLRPEEGWGEGEVSEMFLILVIDFGDCF